MTLKKRAEFRRKNMVGHRAYSFTEAEKWDLEFWQKQTPQDRLSALCAIRMDIEKINQDRLKEE